MYNEDFIFNKWIPALESGEFEQGHHALRRPKESVTYYWQTNTVPNPSNDDHFCCLGVATSLVDDVFDFKIAFNEDVGNFVYSLSPTLDSVQFDGGYLLPEVAKFINIDTHGSLVKPISVRLEDGRRFRDISSLSQLNDKGGTFKVIARVIKRNVKTKNFYTYDEGCFKS